MALFRRNKIEDADTVPPELQTYYQSVKRERTGIAWLLALATLCMTLIITIGLFFGGRWTYRKITQKSKPATVSVQNQPATSSSPSTSNPANKPQTSSTATNTPNTPATTPPTTTPKTQLTTPSSTNSNLPNTGPGDVLAIFIISSLIGAIFYDRVLRAS